MNNNDVLRSLRYLLDISDAQLVGICQLADYSLAPEAVAALLKKDDEEGFQPCSDEVLAHFLAGLVLHKRGRDESRPPLPVEKSRSVCHSPILRPNAGRTKTPCSTNCWKPRVMK